MLKKFLLKLLKTDIEIIVEDKVKEASINLLQEKLLNEAKRVHIKKANLHLIDDAIHIKKFHKESLMQQFIEKNLGDFVILTTLQDNYSIYLAYSLTKR